MSIFKKREKEDSVKPTELKESVGSSGEEVGVKDASITLKSAFRLKDKKTGNGDDRAGN